jgi:cytochrome b561
MRQVSRYHPLLVTLHWLLAVLLVAALSVGLRLATTDNADPGKLDVLEWHMAGGILILALMVIRFVVRLLTSKPPGAPTGRPRLDRLKPLVHYGFYGLVLAMVGTGYATGLIAGLPAIVFARSGAPLPASFAVYPTFAAHTVLAVILAGLVVLHIAAAFYHHLIRKDRLLGRMGFGRRVLGAAPGR